MITINDNTYFKTTIAHKEGLLTISQLDKVPDKTDKIRLTKEQAIELRKKLTVLIDRM